MTLSPTIIEKIKSKIKALQWPKSSSQYKNVYGNFSRRARTANSAVGSWICPNFKLILDFMVVLHHRHVDVYCISATVVGYFRIESHFFLQNYRHIKTSVSLTNVELVCFLVNPKCNVRLTREIQTYG